MDCRNLRVLTSLLLCFIFCFLDSGCEGKIEKVGIRVLHLKNPDFKEEHLVRIGEEFVIGDTEYSAKIVRVVSDFVLDTKTYKVTSRSKDWNNPAILVNVYGKSKLLYDTWVLKNAKMMHYIKKPGFFFEIIEITLKGGNSQSK